MRAALALALLGLIAGAHAAPRDSIEKGLGHIADLFENGMQEFISHERKFGQRLMDPICERAANGKHPVAAELCDQNNGRRRLSTISDSLGSVQDFLSNVLGEGWSNILPASWSEAGFGWDSFVDFEYNSNLASFMDTLSSTDLSNINDVNDIAVLSESIEGHFCKPDECEHGDKMPSSCSGPKVSIQLRPKVCELDPLAKQVLCEPAKLVLVKSPGSCNHKYVAASVWTGKECKIAGEIGSEKVVTIGGKTRTIPMDAIDLPDFGDLVDLLTPDQP
ncbi:tetratricopeptide repeat [Micractinium conductrix]|uniref:Tetratricopeptide repeat n=1 Tax=Micractinium conductrix TaxID=554055 RepID=A0A2P6VJK3_9CHLO|nr:tetratricopeptide repeat [Micractinium conductrix]|eukprot:PSC74269.1 tetratricopeptide repeat [Micractinium conductrix]